MSPSSPSRQFSRAAIRGGLVRAVRRGSRTVMLTPAPGPRFGNYLYYWLHAHVRQESGDDVRVQAQDVVSSWLAELPAVAAITIPTRAVRPWDQRVWPAANQHQHFGRDFTPEQLHRFVRLRLLGSPLLSRLPELPPETVVVNVRRGDYYSVPEFARLFGFDIAAYLAVALDRVRAHGEVKHLLVVSDDPAWCREQLDSLLRGVSSTVSYSGGRSPHDDFATIAAARRLVGTNSTFSYWGGYTASTRNTLAHVVMPRFHARSLPGARAYQLDPAWDIVEELPGGWGGPAG